MTLLKDIPKDQGIGMKYTGWLLVVCGLTQLSRGVNALLHHPSALFEPSNASALAFLCFAVAMMGGSFGFLVMMGERLMADLKDAQRQTAQANFELNQLRLGLENAVVERTAQLHEAQLALGHARKLESLGRLAGGVAHDFNNFLTVIRGYSRLLAQGLGPASPWREDVKQMNAACEQALLLTQQLLAFSRRQSLEPRVLDLNQVILSMTKMLAQLLGDDIEVVIASAAPAARVKADPGQMHQVILNLFLNARDAMPDGGKLTIGTAEQELTAADARRHPDAVAGRYVVVTIGDGGTGMDEDTQSHIFEPFFTTKPMGLGTGLGLATVYGIVKQSGGHIQVDTEPGKGTTFRIFLPSTDEELTEQTAESASGGNSRSGFQQGRVLIVDDAAAIRTVLRRVLESAGYDVTDAADVDSALELLRRSPVDVVLTDVQMPGRSGVELAQLVIRDYPGIKVIAMSGFEDTHVSQLPRELGIDASLTKPMHPEVLIGAVREAMERAKAARPV